jgi:hypothetical protein
MKGLIHLHPTYSSQSFTEEDILSQLRNYIRSAMFVDFDNIYITYQSEDKDLANEFAMRPEKWLEWVEQQMPTAHVREKAQRKVLVRRCYMNPVVFAQHRPFFTRAGFEVIDCPPLTTRGKTSTDIHMVMDALDTLQHSTHFDEFIILSGDADFTPVLLRLRKHDRSTAVLAAGMVSPAYKAAADFVIDQEAFVQEAIGFMEAEIEAPITPAESTQNIELAPFMEKITSRLQEVIRETGPIPAVDLPRYYKEITGFSRKTNWLGCGSLRRLTEVVVAHSSELTLTKEDPWRVDLLVNTAVPGTPSLEPSRVEETPPSYGNDTLERVRQCIISFVTASRTPVAMPKMADVLAKKFGQEMVAGGWLGKGRFTNLLNSLDLGDIRMTAENPAHLFVPSLHQAEVDLRPMGSAFRDDLPMKINKITEVPRLSPADYEALFNEIHREIMDNDFVFNQTSKNVRDHCVENGHSISRSTVNFVISGLQHVGTRLRRERIESPRLLAEKFYENVLGMCANAQFPLSEDEKKEVYNWIVGEGKAGTTGTPLDAVGPDH